MSRSKYIGNAQSLMYYHTNVMRRSTTDAVKRSIAHFKSLGLPREIMEDIEKAIRRPKIDGLPNLVKAKSSIRARIRAFELRGLPNDEMQDRLTVLIDKKYCGDNHKELTQYILKLIEKRK